MEATLIVHADDLGYSRAVNRAILRAHRCGVLNSCSFLVAAPAADHAATMVQSCRSLGVGVHLSLTTALVLGRDAVPRLTAAFPALLDVVQAWRSGTADHAILVPELERLERAVPGEEVEREFEAQVARFSTLVGRRPTHLDTHQHVHVRPLIRDALVRVAQRHALPVRQMNPALQHDLRHEGIPTTDVFVEAPTDGQHLGLRLTEFVETVSQHAHGVTEVLFHPGFRGRHANDAFDQVRPLHLRALLGGAAARWRHTGRIADYGAVSPYR